ncbi:MAG: hypothetical protein ACMZ64_05245 [Oleiphilus sp.]
MKNSTYSDRPIKPTQSKLYKDKDCILFLQTALFETKQQCEQLLEHTETSQLRSVLYHFTLERKSLITCVDQHLENQQDSLILERAYSKKISALYQEIDNLIYKQTIVFEDIILTEQRILQFVKWLLIASDRQPIRHWLSSLAASIQIGLDKLEQQA